MEARDMEVAYTKRMIYSECRNKAIKKLLQEYNYENLIKEGYDYLKDFVPETNEEDFKDWLNKRRECYNSRYRYIMFTINFKEGIDLQLMKKKVLKSVTKKWILHYHYQYECRGFDGRKWTGIHIHMVCEIKEDKNAYNCKREMYNTFKDCVGNKQHVNVRYSNRDKAFVDYVNGYKGGEKKENFDLDRDLNKYIANM